MGFALAVGDHGNARSFNITGCPVDGVDNLRHGEERPFHVNETFIPVGSGTLFGKSAIGAIGRAPFGIVNQQVDTSIDGATVHSVVHQSQGNGRGVTHLGVIRALFFFSHYNLT